MFKMLTKQIVKYQPWVSLRLPRTIIIRYPQITYWQVIYQFATRTHVIADHKTGRLLIQGSNTISYQHALFQWLKSEAKKQLIPRLKHLSQLHNIPCNKASVRHQKRRLGSCSSNGNISLNLVLLFLDPSLVDYVICHELTHILHMNHSKVFWEQLNTICSNAKHKEKQTQLAYLSLQQWIKKK